MPLKYLFTAEYKDNSTYSQNEEDISISDPKRSCFYDVKQDEVKCFFLKGEGHAYSVDLVDGHFEVDGVPFGFHDEDLKDFRLIFWREHTHETGARSSHKIVYLMGWQSNDKEGRNVKKIMRIT